MAGNIYLNLYKILVKPANTYDGDDDSVWLGKDKVHPRIDHESPDCE